MIKKETAKFSIKPKTTNMNYKLWAVLICAFLNLAGCPSDDNGPSVPCVSPPDASGQVYTNDSAHCYTPDQIRFAYGIDELADRGLLGQGQTIVLIDAYGSPTAADDLQFFYETFFSHLPPPDFEEVFPLGMPDETDPDAVSWSSESTLDIQWSYAVAPLAKIVLASLPNADIGNLVEGMTTLVDDFDFPPGTVFSLSLGIVEQDEILIDLMAREDFVAELDVVLKRGSAKGYTFFVAAGDCGTTGTDFSTNEDFEIPTVQWPASSPYVTAVGGTQLQLGWRWFPVSDTPFLEDNQPNPAYFSFRSTARLIEVVWNESWGPFATGGGQSVLFERPTWQDSVGDVIGVDARGVPDVAMNAAVNGGVLVYLTAFPDDQRPGWRPIGGTSAATPQMAALTALVNQHLLELGLDPVGHFNPLLYQIGNSDAFNDIVAMEQGKVISGELVDNQKFMYNEDGSVSPGPVQGFPTLPGWDMTTGFGTPNAPRLLEKITEELSLNQF